MRASRPGRGAQARSELEKSTARLLSGGLKRQGGKNGLGASFFSGKCCHGNRRAGVCGLGVVKIAYSAAQVEETAKQIAEMANRNERMTQSILQKVYDVSRPQA